MAVELIPDVLQNKAYTLEEVPLDELLIDELWFGEDGSVHGYQRPRSQRKLNDILKAGYSDISAGVYLVSVRPDGKKYVMDGGHRRDAAKLSQREKALCILWTGLTFDEEAQIYEKCNSNNKKPEALQLFWTRISYGDGKALILKKYVERAGLVIAPYSGGFDRRRYPKRVEAIRAVEYVYDQKDGDGQTVVYVLSFLHSCWPDDSGAFYDIMIKGFYLFQKYYRGKFDEKRLRKKVQRLSVRQFTQDAHALAISYDSGPQMAVARMFLRLYNRDRPAATKLQDIIE